MSGVAVIFFMISIVLLSLCILYLASSRRPGVYPPKYILKKRAETMAIGSVVCFLIGFMLYMFK